MADGPTTSREPQREGSGLAAEGEEDCEEEEIDDVAQMNFNILDAEEVLELQTGEDNYLTSQMGFHPDSDEDNDSLLFDLPQFDSNSLVAPDGHHWSASGIPKHEAPSESCEQGFRLQSSSRKEAFFAIFDEILDLVVAHTNTQARRLFSNWKITTKEELRALLGLVAITGVFKAKHRRLRELWNDRDGHVLFPATMSFGRFSKLRAALQFSDPRRRAAADRLQPVKEVLRLFNEKLRQLYEPGPNLAIGQMFVEFQGPVVWQEISKMSSGKFGIKIFWIVDAANTMPLQCALYTGQDGALDEDRYVLQLSKSYLCKGRNITMGKEFTSVDICRQLAKKDTTVVGAVRPNSPEVPSMALATADRVRGDTKWLSSRSVELCSHWDHGEKPTLLLATKPSAKNKAAQPELVIFHAAMSAAAGQFTASVHDFSSNPKGQGWPSAVFFALFDAAVVAAHKLSSERTEDLYSFKKELAYELCEAFVKRRLTLPLLRASTKESIFRSFPAFKAGPVAQGKQVRLSNASASHGRCTFCPRISDRKTRKRCVTCKRFICGPHQFVVCPNCFK